MEAKKIVITGSATRIGAAIAKSLAGYDVKIGRLIDENNPKKFKDITAGAFLEERLKELGLKK